jgi:hypothetical protein
LAFVRRDTPEPGLKIAFVASCRIRGEETVVPLDLRDVFGRDPLPHREPRTRVGQVVLAPATLANERVRSSRAGPGQQRQHTLHGFFNLSTWLTAIAGAAILLLVFHLVTMRGNSSALAIGCGDGLMRDWSFRMRPGHG